MANLRDIKPSISQLTWEEQLRVHEAIRESRRTLKVKPKVVRKRKTKLEKVITAMSLEELEELNRLIEEQAQK